MAKDVFDRLDDTSDKVIHWGEAAEVLAERFLRIIESLLIVGVLSVASIYTKSVMIEVLFFLSLAVLIFFINWPLMRLINKMRGNREDQPSRTEILRLIIVGSLCLFLSGALPSAVIDAAVELGRLQTNGQP